VVLKPEALYQVYVSDGYPEVGSFLREIPLVSLDGEDAGRGWLEYLGSAAYFPLEYGMGEYQSGYFRDTWVEREGEGGGPTFVDMWDPFFGRFMAATPLPRTFWLAKGTAYPDGNWSDSAPWALSPPQRSTGLQIWSWDGRGYHPMLTETRYFSEPCLDIHQASLPNGYALLLYGHGFSLRGAHIPSWTRDRAQGDPREAINSFYPLHNREVDLGDWVTDWPWITYPVFAASDPAADKVWVGVTVNYEQTSRSVEDYVRFKVYIRRYEGVDWEECVPSETDLWDDETTATLSKWSSGSKDFVAPAGLDSRWCQVKIEFYPQDTTLLGDRNSNIKVVQTKLVYDTVPAPIVQFELVIAAADHQQLHVAGKDSRTAKEIVTELRALFTGKTAFAYKDVWGNSRQVRAMGYTEQPFSQIEQVPSDAVGFVIESRVALALLDVTWPVT
jgi:hypothetical protein